MVRLPRHVDMLLQMLNTSRRSRQSQMKAEFLPRQARHRVDANMAFGWLEAPPRATPRSESRHVARTATTVDVAGRR